MTPKLVGIEWFLVTQMNISNYGVLVFSWLTCLNTHTNKKYNKPIFTTIHTGEYALKHFHDNTHRGICFKTFS